MAELKTKPTDVKVEEFIEGLDDEKVKSDCRQLVKLMQRVTDEPPKMWGGNMVGFGQYHYRYDSGHEGDAFVAGFSPRKGKLAVYLMGGFTSHEDLMERLGKFKTGNSCLYIKSLGDVDAHVLEDLVRRSVEHIRKKYPG